MDANLRRIFTEAGVPEGVISVVTGGLEAGQALVEHPEVDKITLHRVHRSRAPHRVTLRRAAWRCSLEMGGKSAAIVLEDVDLLRASMLVFWPAERRAGMRHAQTRVLVPPVAPLDEIVDAMIETAKTFTRRAYRVTEAKMGPIITDKQRARSRATSRKQAEGATAVLEGGAPRG